MPKILFIAAHRPGRSPSQRFRFEQYFNFLKANGFDFDFSYLISEDDDKKFYSSGNYFTKFKVLIKSSLTRVRDIGRINNYDIIFVQREAFMTGTTYFEKKFSKSRAKLIFDFDDSIWLSNVSDGNKNLEWLKDYSKTGKIIEMSDLVIAGNQYLANYALNFNQNVKIIPTTIDTDYHRKKKFPDTESENSSGICIGWTGTSTTLKHFQLIIPALKKVKEKFGEKIYFKVIVDNKFDETSLGIKATQWRKQTEIEDLSEIDIGIMPLPENDWSRGKCGFKGLQYMALEIPTVMSPIGVNNEIINDGVNGFLANSENDWIEKISRLIESEELRKKIGGEARKTVIARYSVESQKNNYLKYFTEVLNGIFV